MQISQKEKIARGRVCLPLDGLYTLNQVKKRVEELSPLVGIFKIGKELFTRFGPEVIKLVRFYKADVFLDLKYHDIPNTIKGAANAAAQSGVYMFNIHASGGLEMMRAAVEGAQEGARKYRRGKRPKIIGVTVLTSIDQGILNNELRIKGKLENQVLHLAKLSQEAGLDGIVCSAADLSYIRNKLPADFLYVTPGIKGLRTEAGADQKRVFAPGRAIQDGSSILVIGRAITAQLTKRARLEAGYRVLEDMAGYL